ELAGPLIEGLLAAGAAFDCRLPELYAGDGRDRTPRPVPYPAACRPQAWAAAPAGALLQGPLGLQADGPGGRLLLRPVRPQPAGALAVSGLVAGGQPLRLRLDRAGAVVEANAGSLAVDIAPDRAAPRDTAPRGSG